MSYGYSSPKERWKAINVPSVKYHLEQLLMQVGSCERQIEQGNLDSEMLEGYIGELMWQINGLKELTLPEFPDFNEEHECTSVQTANGWGAYCPECGETTE